MKCPACNRKSCACFGAGWRDHWTLQAVHERMLKTRPLDIIGEMRLLAVYHFLVGRKPTRRELKERSK